MRETSDGRHERFANAVATVVLADVQVLDIDARAALPGRVVREEQHETDGGAVEVRDHRLERTCVAEAVAAYIVLGEANVLHGLALELSEEAHEFDDGRGVVRRGRAHLEG